MAEAQHAPGHSFNLLDLQAIYAVRSVLSRNRLHDAAIDLLTACSFANALFRCAVRGDGTLPRRSME